MIPHVAISQPEERCSVLVRLSPRQRGAGLRRAVLLDRSGVRIRTFALPLDENELSLHGLVPGLYSIRVETGDDVTVQQISI